MTDRASVVPSAEPAALSQASESRWVWLAVATILSLSAGIIPSSGFTVYLWNVMGGEQSMSLNLFAYLSLLFIGVVLALSSPRQSGLVVGEIAAHWWKVLIVCMIPIVIMLLEDPSQGENPFSGQSYTMWLISPLAQDLIFIGFLYGQLDRVLPGHVHRRVPVTRALLLTAFFFAIFHLPNLAAGMSPDFMVFQLLYTGIGLLIVGLSRQWTGSMLYTTLTHTAVNFLSWFMVA